MTIINIKKEFKLKLKIPVLYRVYFLIEQFLLGSGNLILLDGLENTLCLFTESGWKKIVNQFEQGSKKDGVDKKTINTHLSNFDVSKIRTRIDFRGNISIPYRFTDFRNNDQLFFIHMREMLMISLNSLQEMNAIDPRALTGNGLIISLHILNWLEEDAPDGPPTKK